MISIPKLLLSCFIWICLLYCSFKEGNKSKCGVYGGNSRPWYYDSAMWANMYDSHRWVAILQPRGVSRTTSDKHKVVIEIHNVFDDWLKKTPETNNKNVHSDFQTQIMFLHYFNLKLFSELVPFSYNVNKQQLNLIIFLGMFPSSKPAPK